MERNFRREKKNKIEFEKIKGANKIYTNYLRNKTKTNTKIEFLENDKGEKLYGSDAVKHAHEEFKKIVKNEPINPEMISKLKHGNKFDDESKTLLNKEFTEKEIRDSIKMTPNKAPGPSGVRITLFKRFIDDFAPILTQIANEALLCGTTGQFLMKGTITLIPKKENSQKVNDLRPITLLEIARKIITKAMTLRMKKCLSKNNIINENQFCHPGRLIHDNVHTLRLLIERAKQNKKPLHSIFLDCSKAFDFVNHTYLIEILQKRDCGDNFLNFVKCFLKGTSKIRLNGFMSDDLEIERGVPQGETMSPFLFILAIDPLLNSIQKDKNIKGIKVGNKRVKVMAYADDLVLITEDKDDATLMLEHVKNYEEASNAKLNEKKSQILSFGKEIIEKINNIEQCKEGERIRHLGFYFDKNGLINNIDEIINKLIVKLKILRNLYPNFTTRVNIWKGYAISSLLYQSELIVITEKQIEQFEELEKWFLFSQTISTMKKNTVSDLKKK